VQVQGSAVRGAQPSALTSGAGRAVGVCIRGVEVSIWACVVRSGMLPGASVHVCLMGTRSSAQEALPDAYYTSGPPAAAVVVAAVLGGGGAC
jgi:hypothetical protein